LAQVSRRKGYAYHLFAAMRALIIVAFAAVAETTPNTCQPRSTQPFMPIYHIIGNVTSDATGQVTQVESINDVSSVIEWPPKSGLYHIYHQCCQNHWDHVVSRDLIHWTRLPPPIVPGFNPTGVEQANWYDARGSFDGSLSIPTAWNGIKEPMVVMTAVEGKANGIGMAVVRPTNSSDPFMLSWTKDAANPINFTSGALTTAYDTPGQVWKNGDHWNFLILGQRYVTKDPSFHTWGLAPGKSSFASRENGGQWFSPIANLADGSKPAAPTPQWMMNVGGGNRYDLGNYFPANETWAVDRDPRPAYTSSTSTGVIDSGPDANWMVGQFAGDRFMNIGWVTGGAPMHSYTDQAPSGPWKGTKGTLQHSEEIDWFKQQPPPDASNQCLYTQSWEVLVGATNIDNRMPSPTNVTHGTLHFIGQFDTVDECFAAVNASKAGPFHSFTWNDASLPQPYGRHCWADTSMTWQNRNSGCKGQVSGRGPGFPLAPPLPPQNHFTHDHLTGLREVAFDPTIQTLISNPVRELVGLRNGTLGSAKSVALTDGKPHVVSGTGYPADASTADVVAKFSVPSNGAGAIGVSVLANTSGGVPFGGVLTIVNFSTPDTNGTIKATASIRTLDPCAAVDSPPITTATFPILKGEELSLRVLVDRSVVEVFVMGGRVVFTKTYNPSVLYVPDTNVVLHAWGNSLTASADVFSMGCGWTGQPYQPHPTMESILTEQITVI